METLLKDLRFAASSLSRRPWFTAAAVLCLGLGLGAASAIFTLVDAVLLRALPYDDPERIVLLWNGSPREGIEQLPFSAAEFLDLRDGVRGLSAIAATIPAVYSLTGDGEPERLSGMRVSATLTGVLGVRPALGRAFRPEEDRFGNERVVLLSHGLWQRRFGGEPGVVGRSLNLDGAPYEVVGVLPADFHLADTRPDLYVPVAFNLIKLAPRQTRGLTVFGRLAPGVTREQAEADLAGVVERMTREHSDAYPPSGWKVTLSPIRDEVVGNFPAVLLALAGAVGLVLLIACANVANLLLARATARGKEVAIRVALGARRRRLIRQFLTESALLALAGAALGLLIAHWAVRTLVALEPANIPRVQEVALDARAVLFTVLVALLSAALFGLAPALQATRPNLQGTLKEGGKTSAAGAAGRRLRSALVVAEVALAVVVLVGAGLVVKSFRRLADTDPGFRVKNLLTAQILLPRSKYPEPGQAQSFYRELLPRLAALPGVRAAGATSALPLGGFHLTSALTAEGREGGPGTQLTVNRIAVDPGYFRAMEIPLRRGRAFTAADAAEGLGVAIVDEGLAARLWPGEDPLGRRIHLEQPDPFAAGGRTVVGVAGAVRQQVLETPTADQVYVPFLQYHSLFMSLVLRTEADPAALAGPVREAVWSLDRDQALSDLRTMEQVLAGSIATARVGALLFGLFAAVALALAVVGVYGVMAYTVAQRTQEIGIRMSLGARPGDVLRLVVRQGLVLTGAGLALGTALALAATRLLEGFLFGIARTDLLTFAEVLLLLLALGLTASLLPARRATRVDPLQALRYE